ncbi:MAG: TonB-dependent receptor [Flavobacteriales bacterium]|jgi:hypothetical protein|nr:TonB-dependent receptor [Flavobacteriales bacterium]MBT6744949.1 TonB-dependent receptor [Flavobacteriales bacterium]
MLARILTLLFILIQCVSFAQNKFTISGYVTDAETGEELLGAQIFVKELGTGGVTNIYGYYSLTIPPGNYTVTYSFVGFAPITKTFELSQNLKKDIELGTNAEVLKEFEVVGEAENNNVESIEMSVVKMEMETIKKIPALMGEVDILRAIKLLPGVQSGGEGSTGFFVRGGGLDQNLILIDGASVYNASHLLGFFSVFNADAIKGAQLYKGGIPAEYGGRLSSVLDVRMKEGNQKKLSVSGGIGIISSRLTIEAPIIKDRWSFILSGRRTYIDVFTPLSPREEIQNSDLWFYDLNGKTSFKINDKNRVFASYYSGRDALGLNNSFGITWGNKTGTVRWNHLFSDKLFSNLTYIKSNFDYQIGIPEGKNAFEWNSRVKNNSLKNDYTYYLNTKNTIKFGWESTFYKLTPAEFYPINPDSEFDSIAIANKYAWENAIYISNEMKIGNRWSSQYGLRYSIFSNSTQFYNENKTNVTLKNGKLDYNPDGYYNPSDTVLVYDENYEVADTNAYHNNFNLYNNYHGPEPRISVKYKINDASSIKASYNRMRQYLHLATNTSGGTPIDIWVASSPNIKPQLADQVAMGYFKNFKKNMFETSVEVYYKKMYNQLDWKDHANLIFNRKLDGEIRVGGGHSYGLELYIHKQKGNLTGWISYTLSRTIKLTPAINNGNPYLANHDRRHNIAIVASYDFSDRLNLSANWVYVTGAPMTVPVGKYEYQGQLVTIYSERNGGKMPDYHRLDFALTYDLKKIKQKYEHGINFSVYNVYRRKNPYAINFVQNETNPNKYDAKLTYLFDIVPSLTYNFKF